MRGGVCVCRMLDEGVCVLSLHDCIWPGILGNTRICFLCRELMSVSDVLEQIMVT